jgi:hypothetical protein
LSDMYTLTIASADPQSISANKPVHFTKSVTKWYVFIRTSQFSELNEVIKKHISSLILVKAHSSS